MWKLETLHDKLGGGDPGEKPPQWILVFTTDHKLKRRHGMEFHMTLLFLLPPQSFQLHLPLFDWQVIATFTSP